MTAAVDSVVVGAQPERTVYLVHGILGAGRNWRSFARRWADRRPDLRLVLVDQRNHGGAPPSLPPHDLAACAADLTSLAGEFGAPDAVVGHSFGGKVALVWADLHQRPVWVLDSPPGAEPHERSEGPDGVRRVLAALRAAPGAAVDRSELRAALAGAGLPEAIVTWLLSSTRRRADGHWEWMWNLDGVEAMIADYFAWDLWPVAERVGATLVRAGRSDRWTASDLSRAAAAAAAGRIQWRELPGAGHWLHVDDPDGLLDRLDDVAR